MAAPRIIVHTLAHGRAALQAASELGRPVTLVSPPGAAGWQGIGWWRQLEQALRAEFPDTPYTTILDCGDAPGLALAALRAGVSAVWVDAPEAVLVRLSGIAEQEGGAVGRVAAGALLDLLGDADPHGVCGEFLNVRS